MKKRILIVGGIVIAVAVAGGLFWKYKFGDQSAAGGEVAYVSTISTITGYSSGITNRYAGVVEAQETVEVSLDSGRKVNEVQVKVGQEVKKGQLLFEYDLSSIEEDLQQAQLDLDRLKNEALGLTEQIATLEKEKKKASNDNQLSYTIEIETNRMNLKKNEYDQKSKEAEIQKLQSATGNTEVRSEIDGIVQKIDMSKMSTDDGDYMEDSMSGMMMTGDDNNNTAFITILSTGAYRVKGSVNEQNVADIVAGEPVIIRSRVDEDQIWRGTMGTIDTDNASSGNNSNSFYGMVDTNSSQTSSSTYPFYVELASSEGLMLGQHVYIENDEGQEDKKDGIWISEYYIVDVDTPDPYVWAVGENKRLEKRKVVLGQYDMELAEYEILEGLTMDDAIAYPSASLKEGMSTSTNMNDVQLDIYEDDSMVDMEMFDDAQMIDDMEMFDDSIMMDDIEMYDDSMMMDDIEMYDDSMMMDGMDIYDDSMMMDDIEMYEESMMMDDMEMYDQDFSIDNSAEFNDFDISSGTSDMDVFSDEEWMEMEDAG